MIQSYIFLRLACDLNQHNNFYQMNYQGYLFILPIFIKNSIFFHTLLPFLFLNSNSEEFSIFRESPEKFLSFTLDTCNRKENDSLKSSVCLFIQALARNVDGFLSFVFGMMKECLVFSVLSNNLAEIEANLQNYPVLKQFTMYQSNFITSTGQETRIETPLLVFAVLHEEIIKRDDLR